MPGRRSQLRGETNPILTQFAIGYAPAANRFIGRLVAPIVRSDTESGTLYSFGKEGFMIYDTERALRAKAKQIDFHLSKDTYVCKEHALLSELDYKELDQAAKYGAQRVLQLEKRAINLTQRALETELEKGIADILFSATYYATGNKVTLTGTDKFSDYANSDPINIIVKTGIPAARADMGVEPNVCVIGYTAWKTLKFHPQFSEKIKYSQRDVMTETLLAEILGVQKVIVGRAQYASDAGVFTDIWGDYIALVYVPMDANGNMLSEEMIEGTTPHTVVIEETGYPEVKTYDREKTRGYETTRKYVVKNLSTSFGYLISDTV